MAVFPGSCMSSFPIEWYVADDSRGWIVCEIWNRMMDIGDGELHQASNLAVLHYAGDGLWSYEEDVYNPAEFHEDAPALAPERRRARRAAGRSQDLVRRVWRVKEWRDGWPGTTR